MTSEEYFYFEWLIVEKKMTSEIYSSLSKNEVRNLINEYEKFVSKQNLNSLKKGIIK
jgi:hypothetical protein